MAKRFSFANLPAKRRRQIALIGNKVLHERGLAYQFKEGDIAPQEAGRLGGQATMRKWKISRRGKELRNATH